MALRRYKDIFPKVDASAYVDESAQVIGDVVIGAESGIWPGVVVRGDVNYIRIGARTNIQDNSTLHVTRRTHPLVVGDDCTVGHAVILHGCTLRDHAFIGMGAVVMDGAEVGEFAMVGAGALVTQGKQIPPRSLAVGSPAKVVRELTDDEVERIRRSAKNYVEDRLNFM
ncbi:MAG: gamma carbonic anhydrase family protein [Nitrospirota bacterium]|nr:gamma carbonic anhydrase family protein [Nitrospirota bacterium]